MANTALTVDLISRTALEILENNLVLGKLARRDYERNITQEVNGYKPGSTIRVRRPALYTVRDGATAQVQDSIEGYANITVNKQKGVDLQFTSSDMTLKVSDFAERFLSDPMVKLANQVDMDLFTESLKLWNWVGTPGEIINSWSDFSKGPQRLDEMAVPKNDRYGIMTPGDGYPLAGSFSTNTFAGNLSRQVIEEAALPPLAGVRPYIAQNVISFTTGSRTASGASQVDGASQNVTYDSVKNTYVQDLNLKGLTNGNTIAAGDVFSIAGVKAVNPVSKTAMSYDQQFVVQSAVTVSGTTATISIAPPIIISGAYQTVSEAPADSDAVTWVGTASTPYNQNIVCQKGALALTMVPMELPGGAVVKSRQTYKGLSVRMIQAYDATNDLDFWRLDVLYGTTMIDPRLGTRLSGTA